MRINNSNDALAGASGAGGRTLNQVVRHAVFLLLLVTAVLPARPAVWTGTLGAADRNLGPTVDIKRDGQLVARLIYGEGQIKPFLHVYGVDGEPLTNGGLDEEGKTAGQFPHHRGIFIGWKISSDLGTHDLWHMTAGARMDVVRIEKVVTTGSNATIVARVEWRAPKKDADGNDVLLSETRRLIISRDAGGTTQVDGKFILDPARDLKLVGDLQHSGVHFRAANEVSERKAETSYLFEPDKVVKGDNLKWCRLVFPIGKRWYAVQQINPPSNPVAELSMRDYGRFGYFFKKDLKKGEPLELNYRFLIQPVEAHEKAPSRADCDEKYRQFVKQ